MVELNGARSRPIPEEWILTPDELAVASVVAQWAARGEKPPRGRMEEATPESHRLRWGDYPRIAKSGLLKILRKHQRGLPLDEGEDRMLTQIRTGHDIDSHYRTRPLKGLGTFVNIWFRQLPDH